MVLREKNASRIEACSLQSTARWRCRYKQKNRHTRHLRIWIKYRGEKVPFLCFIEEYIYLDITTWRCVVFVTSPNTWFSFNLNLLRFNLDMATTWLVVGVGQWTDFRVHGFQVWRRSKTHLHFVHRYFWKRKFKIWFLINLCFKSFFLSCSNV